MSGLFTGVDAIHASLDYHLTRHNLLASNLAHVDTPGYVPKDMAREGDGDFGNTLALAQTKSGGAVMQGSETTPAYNIFEDPSPSATGLDKNSVSLDREAAKVASNQIRYDVVTVLAQSELSDLQFAANDGH